MLQYSRIDSGKRIDPAESNNSKERIVCEYWLFSHGFKFQNSVCNVAMIWQCCVLVLAILLLLVLKGFTIIALFMTLADLKKFICYKNLCLKIMGMYKMYVKEIKIKNWAYSYHFDNSVKEKLETKNKR